MTNRTKAYLAMLGVTVVWGAAFPIVKPSFDYVSPVQFLFFRYLFVSILLFPLLIFYLIKLKPKLKQLIIMFFLELSSYLFLILLYQGLKLTSVIEASLIGSLGPILTVLGGVIFLKEKEEAREWKGLIISFLGTLILVFEPLISGSNHSATFSFKGNLLITAYHLSWTVYLLFAKKLYRTIPKVFIASFSAPVGLLSLFTILLITNASTSLTLLTIPAVTIASGYMAIFGSIIGFTLYLYGQSLIEASEACLFTYLQPLVGIPLAMWLLNETISWPQIIAVIIISFGVFLGEYKPRRSLAKLKK